MKLKQQPFTKVMMRCRRSLRVCLRTAGSALVVTLLLAVTTSSGGRTSPGIQQPTQDATLVCVVSQLDVENPRGNMDAVLLIENGKLVQPYPEYNEAAQRKFASQYFSPGKKYRVTFGGGEVGVATVKGFNQGCNNIHATALVEGSGRSLARSSALATNSESLGSKPPARREATALEHQSLLMLAHQLYQTGGTAALRRNVVNYNLTATDLDGDGKFELIASFIAAQGRARRDLFLIAQPAGTWVPFPGSPRWPRFKPALAYFQSYKLPPEGFDSAVDFVDQLDLDGDGIAEVFVQQHGFDAYGYAVYKKSKGRWRSVYTITGDAC